MRILFFSTNSNYYEGKDFKTRSIPSCKSELDMLAQSFPDDEFAVVTNLPGMFFLDLDGDALREKSSRVEYHITSLCEEDEIADFIFELHPEIAVAASFYTAPFDWLSVKDALVAEKLRAKGIRTVCHPLDLTVDCFDKWRTHAFLTRHGFPCPKAVYVHHSLFINAGNRRQIKSNVYKSSVFAQIEKLHFPVVIKDTVGLSSYGTDVLNSFSEVENWLKSKKFTSDRIVEEFIGGAQFGTEITGARGNYKVMPPLLFSVNKYGITSPKQSVKTGPVPKDKFSTDTLEKMLLRLAEISEFEGTVQIDLVFDGKNWTIIEINPRLSGMSATYAAMESTTVCRRILESTGEARFSRTETHSNEKKFVLNIKFPLLSADELQKMSGLPFVKKVSQIENLAAKQLREKGYCEVIMTDKSKEKLKEDLFTLKKEFSAQTEEIFFENALALLEEI